MTFLKYNLHGRSGYLKVKIVSGDDIFFLKVCAPRLQIYVDLTIKHETPKWAVGHTGEYLCVCALVCGSVKSGLMDRIRNSNIYILIVGYA